MKGNSNIDYIWTNPNEPIKGNLKKDEHRPYWNTILEDSGEVQELDFVWFYGISSLVGYLMPNLVYTYLLDIYDL